MGTIDPDDDPFHMPHDKYVYKSRHKKSREISLGTSPVLSEALQLSGPSMNLATLVPVILQKGSPPELDHAVNALSAAVWGVRSFTEHEFSPLMTAVDYMKHKEGSLSELQITSNSVLAQSVGLNWYGCCILPNPALNALPFAVMCWILHRVYGQRIMAELGTSSYADKVPGEKTGEAQNDCEVLLQTGKKDKGPTPVQRRKPASTISVKSEPCPNGGQWVNENDDAIMLPPNVNVYVAQSNIPDSGCGVFIINTNAHTVTIERDTNITKYNCRKYEMKINKVLDCDRILFPPNNWTDEKEKKQQEQAQEEAQEDDQEDDQEEAQEDDQEENTSGEGAEVQNSNESWWVLKGLKTEKSLSLGECHKGVGQLANGKVDEEKVNCIYKKCVKEVRKKRKDVYYVVTYRELTLDAGQSIELYCPYIPAKRCKWTGCSNVEYLR